MYKIAADKASDFLQHAEIDIIDETKCKSFYERAKGRHLSDGVINEQICAGDLNGGKDTCQVSWTKITSCMTSFLSSQGNIFRVTVEDLYK